MQLTNAILAVLPLALASPLESRQSAPKPFTMIAARSASPVHLRAINFFQEGFYIGEPTETFCPSPTVDCSKVNNSTSVLNVASAGKASTAGPYVEVPGGQQTYVAADGSVKNTIAHSGAIPAGSFVDGFVYKPATTKGGLGSLSFNAGGATGFIACPVNATAGTYQVFADVTGKATAGCLGFDALTTEYTGARAWQYD